MSVQAVVVGAIALVFGAALLAFPASIKRYGKDTEVTNLYIVINRILGVGFVLIGAVALLLGLTRKGR